MYKVAEKKLGKHPELKVVAWVKFKRSSSDFAKMLFKNNVHMLLY